MSRLSLASAVLAGALGAGCVLVSSFDRFDPDAPSAAFVLRVDAPAVIDPDTPGTVVVHVERRSPEPVHVSLQLPAGIVVTPAQIDLDATTETASFQVDVHVAPRGDVKGSARAERPDGSATQSAEIGFRATGPGELDPTFGDGGVVIIPEVAQTVELPVFGFARAPGDKLLLGGAEWPLASGSDKRWKVARIAATGIDPSFGAGGAVIETIGTNGGAVHSVAAIGDGIWASGIGQNIGGGFGYDVLVRRYGADGSLVGSTKVVKGASFAPSGVLAPASDGAWVASFDDTHSDFPDDMYKETIVAKLDGKGAIAGGPWRNRVPVTGRMYLGTSATGTDAAPGELLLVGDRLLHLVVMTPAGSTPNPTPMRVAAYAASGANAGQLDLTFGAGGIADEQSVPTEDVHAGVGLAVRSDGSFVVTGGRAVGGSNAFGGDSSRMLVRSFSRDGVYDPAFPNALGQCQGLVFHGAADAAGRIVVVGYYGVASANESSKEKSSLAVVRLRPDGTVDPTFGSPAVAATSCDRPGILSDGFAGLEFARGLRVMVDAAGRILVAGRGSRFVVGSVQRVWFVARFRS